MVAAIAKTLIKGLTAMPA